MKFIHLSTAKRYSLLIAFSIIIAFSVIYLLLSNTMNYKINWTVFSIINIGMLITAFAISRFILDKFIYDKIKLIYKNIHALKYPKEERKAKILGEKDIIKQANQEVMQWAKEKSEEIEELKKLETYRREFLGNVSHELKTPILKIREDLMNLPGGENDNQETGHDYLKNTEKNIDRLITIVEDLEVISRLESGEMNFELTTFNIVELAKEAIKSVELKAKKKDIYIYLSKKYEKPLNIYADREQAKQVFINLLNNAIKYSAANGRCKISFFDMDENILIEVSDRGMGIPAKELPRIFERFYRGEHSRSITHEDDEGTGLGLAIVKHILEAHNQTINVRSTPEVGTTFAFTLKKVKTKR